MTRPEAIRDLLVFFCGSEPPFQVKKDRIEDLSEAQYEKLVKFVTLKATLSWLDPVSVLDSIDNMVDAAEGLREHLPQPLPEKQRRMKANHKALPNPSTLQ